MQSGKPRKARRRKLRQPTAADDVNGDFLAEGMDDADMMDVDDAAVCLYLSSNHGRKRCGPFMSRMIWQTVCGWLDRCPSPGQSMVVWSRILQ